MLLQPARSSGVPLYRQVMERVKRSIETGALRPGEPLPGVRPLAEALVINPNTVAKAYRELEGEGVIDLRADAGGLLAFARAFDKKPSRCRADRRQIDQLYNDLESAREVQQRLLPQESRAMAGLDYAGLCRPAYSVGGDYYDFIRLSDTELGVAVADVCGKGIPAALLMATLRAYLHGETQHGAADPAHVMRTLKEAMNAAGDEWGEERLIELVEANRALSVHALIDRIMRVADEFVGGASQHDDMTIVALRVT